MFSTTFRRALRAPAFTTSRTTIRPISQSASLRARKDAQDKDSLKPEPNEYSKSGSDDAAAATEKAAFDPKQTKPEEEHATAGREAGSGENNPLNVSPANHGVSEPQFNKEGGAGNANQGQVTKDRQSGGSGGASPEKAGGKKSGGGSVP